jgi:hypothetical protein
MQVWYTTPTTIGVGGYEEEKAVNLKMTRRPDGPWKPVLECQAWIRVTID